MCCKRHAAFAMHTRHGSTRRHDAVLMLHVMRSFQDNATWQALIKPC